MKRYPFVLGATVAGLAGVLTFHSNGRSGTAAGASVLPTTPTTRPSATANRSGSAPPGGSGSSAPASGTATGKLEQYGYGELSVRATVSGGRITALGVPTLQTAESYSQQIAVQVIPMLRNEVLHAQTAQIQGITGATYTSEAYALSLQSALDKLHFK